MILHARLFIMLLMSKEVYQVIEKEVFTDGDRIRLARLGSGVKVRELAERMGIKPVSLYGKENGNEIIPNGFMERVEKVLGITQGTLGLDSCDMQGSQTSFSYERKKAFRMRTSPKQIAEVVKGRILDGTYEGLLPKNISIAIEFGVSRWKVSAAMNELRAAGLVTGARKTGKTSVRPR